MYLVLETQTTEGQIAILSTQKNSREEAESLYHTILAAAAVSSVPIHSASILGEDGRQLMHERYTHIQESQEA